jgi:predicted naringenin-chalcone synthase
LIESYFEEEYTHEGVAPSDLIHVTCTGYVSPSGAQRVVDRRGWGARTRVTHAYHMGCYASLPALRLALGALHTQPARAGGDGRVDIVHTELCSLHLDPADHSPEQIVVQSLFGDGLIRYSLTRTAAAPSLRLLVVDEMIVPGSSDAMTWTAGDSGMTMTLSPRVPDHIASVLRDFVDGLYRSIDLDPAIELPRSVFAVHPGGPRILDQVRDRLELSEAQLAASRAVLHAYGNMSSATLPHVWMRIVGDAKVRPGTLVLSLAFGPGLTACGALLRKQ